ncbi:MAG: glycosyl transferase family 1 [Blastopirellula sp.]|nr:MAG: glycosyl transferase family 1 [Blastopirellula sp.]
MRVGVVRTQVPFVTGGAERHAANLSEALNHYGHEAVEITLPFKWYPGPALTNSILAAKLTDLSEFEGVPIDLMIGLKFPAYLAQHPNKVFWILHQHRQAYDQWDAKTSDLLQEPEGLGLRHLIHEEDRASFAASPHPIHANSQNVAQRLKSYLGVESQALYHPPPMFERLRPGAFGDYIFAPGRVNPSKRLDLVLAALAETKSTMRLVIAGVAANPVDQEKLYQQARELNITDRVEWLGAIDDDTMIRLYAGARAVVFVPQDEDYGYITLEAMLAGKPVITVTDAGGPLEFVRHGVEGLISAPDPTALATSFEQMMQDQPLAEQLGQAGAARYHSMNISWEHAVETLTGTGASIAAHGLFKADAPQKEPEKEPGFATSQDEAVAALRAAISPKPSQADLPFKNISEVLAAYNFSTLPEQDAGSQADIDPGLDRYLSTHWQRFLSTLDLVVDLRPKRILDIGVFPPFVFEAMLANVLPKVKMQGVWEGPSHYYQKVKGKKTTWPDFEIELRPANIEQDLLPYEDNQFDLVLGMEILEHLALDPNFFLREVARVLRPEGHVLLSTPNIISHRGVWKTLNGHAPYSFGVFVPTGGVYGRHNREYAPKEVEVVAQSAGFTTMQLKTIDVYDDGIDPGTAEMLSARNDDLGLRGETIFYVGRNSASAAELPENVPESLYHGNPIAMDGELALVQQEDKTGLLVIEVRNNSKLWWPASGKQATCFLAEWINADGFLVHTNIFLPFREAVGPAGRYRVSMRLDADPAPDAQGTLVLNLSQSGVGSFSKTGRTKQLELCCSESAFLRLVAASQAADPSQ